MGSQYIFEEKSKTLELTPVHVFKTFLKPNFKTLEIHFGKAELRYQPINGTCTELLEVLKLHLSMHNHIKKKSEFKNY